MKKCSRCQFENPTENRFCQQCGRPLEAQAAGDATVRLSGTQIVRGPIQQTVTVASLFATKERVVIGRAPDCDLVLAHPSVSRYHALLERRPDGLWLRDLASVNGVSLSGKRVSEAALVREGELVGVGPFLLSLTGGVLRSVDNSQGLRLEAHNLEKEVVVMGGSGKRKLLDNVNLVVNPGEFVSLLGPSGSGKSTLMDCLNGRRRATGGRVLANGEDFYRHFDNFRQSLGYVPQKDIVHTQLTVSRALYYTARLRLPTDTEPEELGERIEGVLKQMELGPHRDTLVGNLSGGQIKRVSLGAELLASPSLLFIDEATSGLDAGTEARMMRLFRKLADEGRSVICITHNVDNVDQCHLALVLVRGRLVYYGPPREAPPYFQVARISDVYDRLGLKEPEAWEKQFQATSLFREYVAERLAVRPAPSHAPVPAGPAPAAPAPVADAPGSPPPPAPGNGGEKPATKDRTGRLAEKFMSSFPPLADRFRKLTAQYLRFRDWLAPVLDQLHQFKVLTARYVELIVGDRRGLRLLLLQAPIVAFFLLLGFVNKPYQGQAAELPRLRELTGEEKRALVLLRDMNRVSGEAAPPGKDRTVPPVVLKLAAPEAEKGAKDQPRPLEIDGAQAAALLQKVDLPGLTPEQRAQLKKSGKFPVMMGGLPTTINAAQAYDLVRLMQKQGLAPEQLGELKKTRLQVPPPGKPMEIQATELVGLLRSLKEAPPEQRRAFGKSRFTLAVGGKSQEMTGSDLLACLDAWEKFSSSGIADELLAADGPVVPEGKFTSPRYTYMMLFIVVMIVLWFGCNNAAKEIVKEEAIYGRERAVNLGIVPYLASKFLILTFITLFHAVVLMLVLYGALEGLHAYDPGRFTVPPAQYMLGYPSQLAVMVLLSMCGVALGLLLSACVATPDRANALLPYVLIPQMILGGGIIPVYDGALKWLAQGLSPVYWAFRAVRLGAHDLPVVTAARAPYPDGMARPCVALAVQAVLLLLLTAWFLKRKDVG